MRRLKQQFPNELVIIGVHSAKFPSEHLTANIRQAIMREGLEHPVVNDTGFRIWSDYSVRAWPTLVLIDPHGRIAGQTAGEILAEDFIPTIQQIINQNQTNLNTEPLQLRPEVHLEPQRPLSYPSRTLAASQGILFIADSGHNRIIEVKLAENGLGGEVLRVFGSSKPALKDGSNLEAAFHSPHGMALKGDVQSGILYVADTENHAIRAIDLKDGNVRTVAGTGQKAHGSYELKAPTQTPLRSPWALVAQEDVLFIAMAGSHQLWVLIGEQRLGPFAGNGREALVDGPVAEASFNQPSDLAMGMDQLFVADPEASAVRLIHMTRNPEVTTLVGEGLFEFGDRDGTGPEVRLQHVSGLAFADRLVYLADTYNHKIKILDPLTRRVTTLAGSGKAGRVDGPFHQSQFFEPEGVQALGGRLYIADTNNHQIRVADLSTQRVQTFALRALELLPIPVEAESTLLELGPQEVGAGSVKVILEPVLPAGYKRNPEAIAQLHLTGENEKHQYPAEEEIAFDIQVEQDRDVQFDLSLVYCQAQDATLCLMDSRHAQLRLKVAQGGPSVIRVPYPVSLGPDIVT